MKYLLLLLCSVSPILAEPFTINDPAFIGGKPPIPFTGDWLTNLPGVPVTRLWYASDLVTNAGVVSIIERVKGIDNLTNAASGTLWPIRRIASLNGKDTLSFISGYLRSDTYTNGPPHTLVLLGSLTNQGVSKVVFDSKDTSYRNALTMSIPALSLYAGTSVSGITGHGMTNKFVIWSSAFDGANSIMGTNGTLETSSHNIGTQNMNGLTLGANNALSFNASFEWAVLIDVATNLNQTSFSNLCYIISDASHWGPMP